MLLQVQKRITECATLKISRSLSSSEALIGQWLEIKGEKMGVSQLIGKRDCLMCGALCLGRELRNDENDDRGLVAINH